MSYNKKNNNEVLMQNKYDYQRYNYHLICGKRPFEISEEEFLCFIKNVLEFEKVDESKYNIKMLAKSAFIDFVNEDDMKRVKENWKYNHYEDKLIHFNTPCKPEMLNVVHILGIPLGTNAEVLDDFLSRKYKSFHEVSILVNSDENPNKMMFAEVSFKDIDDAKHCIRKLHSFQGFHVKAFPEEEDLTAYDDYFLSCSSSSSSSTSTSSSYEYEYEYF